jgi:colanic acid/amylovoran biosynthesis glycosyltransferase
MTPLAIFLPEIGLATETFIRWDVTELLPGGTVVVADPPPGGLSQHGKAIWALDHHPSLIFTPVDGDPPPSNERIDEALSFLANQGVVVVLVEYLDFADRWFDALYASGRRIWIRGHGIDLSARLRDEQMAKAYQRYTRADGIIVPSENAAQNLVAVGLPAEKIHVVRYPVQTPSTSRPHAGAEMRCVAVGRLVPKKAPLIMLEAFRLASLAEPHLTLDLVGHGPLMDDVLAYVAAWNLRESVRVHGRVSHDRALELLRGADTLLHHAVTAPDGDTEGQPLAVLEAMAAGLAVVSTNHAGIPEIVTDQVNGRLVAEHDVAAMAAAIISLALDPGLRVQFGSAARRTIGREHTASHARQELRRLLRLEAPS